jgi:2,3-bisphosphoglycerate-independent phosphoglycerate mutase
MQLHEFYYSLAIRNDNKIVVLLIDGLGGMSHKDYGYKTELEYANRPNLDRLPSRGATGMLTPVLPGVTPGSGPGPPSGCSDWILFPSISAEGY